MDRLNELRAKNNLNVTIGNLDISASDVSLGYQTANDSSSSASFLSINDSVNISPPRNVSKQSIDDIKLNTSSASSSVPTILVSDKADNLNLLNDGVNIFDDNSCDGNELVIDDKAISEDDVFEEVDPDNKRDELKIQENSSKLFSNCKEIKPNDAIENPEENKPISKINIEQISHVESIAEPMKDSKKVVVEEMESMQDLIPLDVAQELLEAEDSTNEVVLQIDGKNVDAIDIGNCLYLYRKEDTGELTAIQLLPGEHQQTQFKFLKVRHNEEGNLEVYEEQILEVPLTDEEVNAANVKNGKPSSSASDKPATLSSPFNKSKTNTEVSKTNTKAADTKLNITERRKSSVKSNITTPSKSSKEIAPLTKLMIDRHLPPNKIDSNSSGTKSPKEVLTVTTTNIKTNSSKLSPQPTTIKDSTSSLNLNKSCTALLPFKPHLDILFGSNKSLNQNQTQTENHKSDKQSEASSLKIPNSKDTPTTQKGINTNSVLKTYSRLTKLEELKNQKKQCYTVPIPLPDKLERKCPTTNIQANSTLRDDIKKAPEKCQEIPTKISSEETRKFIPVSPKITKSNISAHNKVDKSFDKLIKTSSQKESDKSELSNLERTITENKFVNKYISEALGVKTVTASTIESLKTHPDKISTDVKDTNQPESLLQPNSESLQQNNSECSQQNNSINTQSQTDESGEFITKELSTQTLINKAIDDIILERLLAPSRPLNMVNADNKMVKFNEQRKHPPKSELNKVSNNNKQRQIAPGKSPFMHNTKPFPTKKADSVKSYKNLSPKTENPLHQVTIKKNPPHKPPASMAFEHLVNLNSHNDSNFVEKFNKNRFDDVFTIQPTKFKEAYQSALSLKMSKEPLRVDLTENKMTDGHSISKTSPLPNIFNLANSQKPEEHNKFSDHSPKSSKHQRKQILNPVPEPDLEIICETKEEEPTNKKRKPEKESLSNIKNHSQIKHKKNYLLDRSSVSESENLSKEGSNISTPKRGRGRPKKNPDQSDHNSSGEKSSISPKVNDQSIENESKSPLESDTDGESDEEGIPMENWTMGKINENIVCPICSKLFRSESVVFKHVKHCSAPDKSPVSKLSPKIAETKVTKESSQSSEAMKETLNKDDVIEIEDSPVVTDAVKKVEIKELPTDTLRNKSQLTPMSRMQKILKTKPPETGQHVCEICGKSFRQLTYLISHRSAHKDEINKKSAALQVSVNTSANVLKCEVCDKGFRKPYHLVQHRLIHKTAAPHSSRVQSASSVQSNKNEQKIDNAAGFRCEACDKSFRKLHHLVEHREIHESSNKLQKTSPTGVASASEKPNDIPSCDVCQKTFRKLHHYIDHREQHEKMNTEENKFNILPKDIIHECPICYMVFPNEFSLNKHHNNCQKKRKIPKIKKDNENETEEEVGDSEELSIKPESIPDVKIDKDEIGINRSTETETKVNTEKAISTEAVEDKEQEGKNIKKPSKAGIKRNSRDTAVELTVSPRKISKVLPKRNSISKPKAKMVKKLLGSVDNGPSKVKTKKAELTDSDDDVRYMINPMYEEGEKEIFFKVCTPNDGESSTPEKNKRTSRSSSSKAKTPKSLKDIGGAKKVNTPKSADAVENKFRIPEARTMRVSSARKAKSSDVTSISSKRKSMISVSSKPAKKPVEKAECKVKSRSSLLNSHICDCGEKFTCEALLLRHTAIAHTPPRVRKNRLAVPPSTPPENQNVKEIVKSIKKSSMKKKVPHTGVPTTDRMKQLYSKLKF